ncbi:MAG: HD domain-containing protein [Pseudomonadota bacterium]
MSRPLSTLDVGAASLESRLAELIALVPEPTLRVGDLDLRELPRRMAEVRHSDDGHHNGESVLEHTRWVLEDLAPLTVGWRPHRARRLRVVAMLHDLGKVPTHAWDDKKQRHTFHGHHQQSEAIARRLLAPFAEDVPGERERLLALVRFHDVFFQLGHARPAEGATRYLRKFAAEAVSEGEALEELATIARADSQRARRREPTHHEIAQVVADLARHRAEEAARIEAQAAAQARREANMVTRRAEIVALLEEVEPGLPELLPDLRAINARLGARKAWDAIRAVEGMLAGEGEGS